MSTVTQLGVGARQPQAWQPQATGGEEPTEMMDTDSALSTCISKQKCRLERKDPEEEGKAVSPNPTGRQSFGLTPYLCWLPQAWVLAPRVGDATCPAKQPLQL